MNNQKITKLYLMILLIPLLVISNITASSENRSKIVVIPAIDSNEYTLSVNTETQVVLWLTTSMGTGYDWVSSTKSIQSNLIKNDDVEKITGVSEIREFLVPMRNKDTTYIFTYKRVWEDSSDGEKKFQLNLIYKGK